LSRLSRLCRLLILRRQCTGLWGWSWSRYWIGNILHLRLHWNRVWLRVRVGIVEATIATIARIAKSSISAKATKSASIGTKASISPISTKETTAKSS